MGHQKDGLFPLPLYGHKRFHVAGFKLGPAGHQREGTT